MSQYRERPECRVKRPNILCDLYTNCTRCKSRDRIWGQGDTAEIEYIWRLQITHHKLLWEEQLQMLHCLLKCTVHTTQCRVHNTVQIANFTVHSSKCKVQSGDAGVGKLKHPLLDHHSQVVRCNWNLSKLCLNQLALLQVAVQFWLKVSDHSSVTLFVL